MPVIGPRTVERAVNAGLGGVMIEAHRVLLLESEAMVEAADEARLFLFGLKGRAAP